MRVLVIAGLVLAAAFGCKDAPVAAIPAAKVEHPVKEAELTTVTLTVDAERRLGVETDSVHRRSLPPTRTLGAEIVTPPGQTFPVLSPVAATVLAPAAGALPQPGTRVTRGQPLLRLMPLPPAADLARGEEDLAIAEARADQAEREAVRTRGLAGDSLVSRRELERVEADLIAARATLASARARMERQRNGTAAAGPGLTPLTIASPEAGIVLDLGAGAGQVVGAGAPLITIANTQRLWARAAIFSGDAALVPAAASARVDLMHNDPAIAPIPARRVTSPPTSNPGASSVDLFFELDRTGGLRPGQRVNVTMNLTGTSAPELVVPYSAVVYDQSGGAWVYVRTAERTYVRQRVELTRVSGEWAVLARGPGRGAVVVKTGVAELFGTEFGAGK